MSTDIGSARLVVALNSVGTAFYNPRSTVVNVLENARLICLRKAQFLWKI